MTTAPNGSQSWLSVKMLSTSFWFQCVVSLFLQRRMYVIVTALVILSMIGRWSSVVSGLALAFIITLSTFVALLTTPAIETCGIFAEQLANLLGKEVPPQNTAPPFVCDGLPSTAEGLNIVLALARKTPAPTFVLAGANHFVQLALYFAARNIHENTTLWGEWRRALGASMQHKYVYQFLPALWHYLRQGSPVAANARHQAAVQCIDGMYRISEAYARAMKNDDWESAKWATLLRDMPLDKVLPDTLVREAVVKTAGHLLESRFVEMRIMSEDRSSISTIGRLMALVVLLPTRESVAGISYFEEECLLKDWYAYESQLHANLDVERLTQEELLTNLARELDQLL